MSDTESAEDPKITQGSIVINQYVQRSVQVFAIHEHELEQISFMNGLGAACFSIMSAFISFAVATWVNVAFQSELSAEAKILTGVVSPAAIVLGVGFGLVGCIAMWKRGSTLKTIKKQSLSNSNAVH